jgi:hypothetical protein
MDVSPVCSLNLATPLGNAVNLRSGTPSIAVLIDHHKISVPGCRSDRIVALH